MHPTTQNAAALPFHIHRLTSCTAAQLSAGDSKNRIHARHRVREPQCWDLLTQLQRLRGRKNTIRYTDTRTFVNAVNKRSSTAWLRLAIRGLLLRGPLVAYKLSSSSVRFGHFHHIFGSSRRRGFQRALCQIISAEGAAAGSTYDESNENERWMTKRARGTRACWGRSWPQDRVDHTCPVCGWAPPSMLCVWECQHLRGKPSLATDMLDVNSGMLISKDW